MKCDVSKSPSEPTFAPLQPTSPSFGTSPRVMASLSLFAMRLCTSKHCLKKHLQHVTIEGCTRGLVQRSQRPISLNSSTMFRQRSKTEGTAKSYLRGVKYWFASFHVELAEANAVDVFKKIYSSGLATAAMALQLWDASVSRSSKMMVGMQHFADWLLNQVEDFDDGQAYRAADGSKRRWLASLTTTLPACRTLWETRRRAVDSFRRTHLPSVTEQGAAVNKAFRDIEIICRENVSSFKKTGVLPATIRRALNAALAGIFAWRTCPGRPCELELSPVQKAQGHGCGSRGVEERCRRPQNCGDTRPIGPFRPTKTDVTAGRTNFEAMVDALWESLTAAQKDEYVASFFEGALAVLKNHNTAVQRNAATPLSNNVPLPPTALDAPPTSDTQPPQLDDDTFHLTASAGHEMCNPRRTRRRHPTLQKATQPSTLHSSPHP